MKENSCTKCHQKPAEWFGIGDDNLCQDCWEDYCACPDSSLLLTKDEIGLTVCEVGHEGTVAQRNWACFRVIAQAQLAKCEAHYQQKIDSLVETIHYWQEKCFDDTMSAKKSGYDDGYIDGIGDATKEITKLQAEHQAEITKLLDEIEKEYGFYPTVVGQSGLRWQALRARYENHE